jgi:DNA-directed RNA polymerase specialized sigma54-like protein
MEVTEKGMEKGGVRSFKKLRADVINALRSAGFSEADIRRLERMMDKVDKRNIVFIQALLTLLNMAGIPSDDLEKLKVLLRTAYDNTLKDQRALSDEQAEELTDILVRNKLSMKTARKLLLDLETDDVLAERLDTSLYEFDMARKKGLAAIPKRK